MVAVVLPDAEILRRGVGIGARNSTESSGRIGSAVVRPRSVGQSSSQASITSSIPAPDGSSSLTSRTTPALATSTWFVVPVEKVTSFIAEPICPIETI